MKWNLQIELDCVKNTEKKSIEIFEVKFSKLKNNDRIQLVNELDFKVKNCKLSLIVDKFFVSK